MAVKTDAEYFEFASISKQTPSLSSEIDKTKKLIPFYKAKSSIQSGKINKPKGSSLNWFSKSFIAHLQKPEFLHSHCILRKNHHYFKRSSLIDPFSIHDSEMNEVGNLCYKKKLPEFTCSRFTVDRNKMDDNMHSSIDLESDSPIEQVSPRFSSPVEHSSNQSSKSQSSIEDLNKEIEKLFLNNTEKYDLSSFVWDQEVFVGGRRAPVADMLTSYKAQNRRKKRRSATALGIRNYNESDSSNSMSSPDEHSGCEEYCKTDSIEKLDPPIVIPVPVGKSSMDQIDSMDFNRPFSGSKFHFSEDSAFAPIKSLQRSQSTPPQNSVDMIEDKDEKHF